MGVTTKAHAVDLCSAKVNELNNSEGRNTLIWKVLLAAFVSDTDSEEGRIVDLPPNIIDRFQRVCENPENECTVPLLERAVTQWELHKNIEVISEVISKKKYNTEIYASVKTLG